jgi:UDP-N-acetyl-D-galactosamine dehydrogenase
MAVGHTEFLDLEPSFFTKIQKENPILLDVKGIYDKDKIDPAITYWRL